ncbi:nicotinate phosphoribosyltransferase [Candidatus Cryosericum odellii]|jgi:nicotinate phosphoribosyltransferase|uniref:Nicotinate phosphoribosyltransferase n=2 Tax=Candidatus Cryosericum odellii TaxID=2290917 RepID=A0A398DG73_9BACT|nr:nicotinate phosphoribosyltransferase [Candidatus Cryosericum odellii]RIE13740.1 nicotinate phosphoribosyltransferase [Candidatus Cryosericum odellii]
MDERRGQAYHRRFSPLYTDYYEYSMTQGYYLSGKGRDEAVFDICYRQNPYGGGYAIAAGLRDAVEYVLNMRFTSEELGYLSLLGYKDDFLQVLEKMRFTGDITAVPEGEVIFPGEPIISVKGPLIETQLLEGLILSMVNFQTLIATKARRMVCAAKGRSIVDFGLRRAQGDGGMGASRACFVGGVASTSNVLLAFEEGVPVGGTMAHSWIQSFDSELEAFRAYAQMHPDDSVLLLDTYDTLRQGLPNAVIVGKELEKQGHHLQGVRLDSGDLAYLSKKVRAVLDEHGLDYVKISVSNQLDEYVIESLVDQGAPIDMFGVGTRLVTGYSDGALDGVYKMVQLKGRPIIKISENPAKINIPGEKELYRYYDAGDGLWLLDGLCLARGDNEPTVLMHPDFDYKKTEVAGLKREKIRKEIVKNGELVYTFPTLLETRTWSAQRFSLLYGEHKRFANPHAYHIGVSRELFDLRRSLIETRSS